MYRLPFELTDSAKLLHFTILGGGPQTLRAPLNDATGVHTITVVVKCIKSNDGVNEYGDNEDSRCRESQLR